MNGLDQSPVTVVTFHDGANPTADTYILGCRHLGFCNNENQEASGRLAHTVIDTPGPHSDTIPGTPHGTPARRQRGARAGTGAPVTAITISAAGTREATSPTATGPTRYTSTPPTTTRMTKATAAPPATEPSPTPASRGKHPLNRHDDVSGPLVDRVGEAMTADQARHEAYRRVPEHVNYRIRWARKR